MCPKDEIPRVRVGADNPLDRRPQLGAYYRQPTAAPQIRDHKYRGTSAEETIRRWPSVRRGEEKWIFPYQENADAMFNSSLLFELGVMKDEAETVLRSVPYDVTEYAEAYRLRKFLSYFLPINTALIPSTSVLRGIPRRQLIQVLINCDLELKPLWKLSKIKNMAVNGLCLLHTM